MRNVTLTILIYTLLISITLNVLFYTGKVSRIAPEEATTSVAQLYPKH